MVEIKNRELFVLGSLFMLAYLSNRETPTTINGSCAP